jgi:DNA-binding response OmpR family regulator
MTQILIIDDEPVIGSMLKKVFEREGYNVIVASNGEDGMKLYKEKQPDIVITDLILPGKEGIQIIMELRKEDPNLPIIGMSGGGYIDPDSYLHLAKSLGANAVFTKPIKIEELLNIVKTLKLE